MGVKGGLSEPELGKLGGSIAGAAHAAAPLPGAVWMTDNEGSHLNQNIYTSKDEVYLSGGPDNQG